MTPDDRRKAIVSVLVPLIAERGGDVSTKEIAQAAGIAEGTIFRVFPDKRSLMLAAAEEAINPADGQRDFEEAIADLTTLGEKVVVVAERVQQRMHLTMSVMIATRSHLMTGHNHAKGSERKPGPPPFVVKAQADLNRRLTTLFEAHRDELAVSPDVAAAALRSLVFGAGRFELGLGPSLTPTQIADLVLNGVMRREELMLVRLVREYLQPYRSWLTVVVALQFVGTVAALYLPSLNADIIDKGVATGDTSYIVRTGAVMLAVALLQIGCSVAAVWFSARTAMSFGRDLRASIFQRVGSFSQREVQHFGAPSLITRQTNDVQQVQMLVLMSCTLMVAAPIMMVGGVVMAMRENLGLSWLLGVSIPALLLTIGFIVSRMVPSFRAMQKRIDEVNRLLREQITGVRVVRAFVREPHETERFAVANQDLTAVAVRAGRWQATMFPTVMLILNVSSVAVLWFGGHRVEDGQMQVGQLTAFLAYLVQILMSVMMATFMLMMVPRSAVCADRITEVLDTRSSVLPPEEPVTGLAEHGTLVFDHVEFTYPGADVPVVRDVSFSAAPGQTVAIIGSTGAGKSTMVNLVSRLFDVTGGRVLVDGVDVRRLDPDLLWNSIGLVPQRAWLFSGTVRSNLQYGRPDATDEQMWTALEIAQGRDFVEAMPEQLDAPISQGGTNVSGGQRQRLAIARALIRNPEIYLFDDSFSALDLTTDARLRAALKPVTRDATVLIVAQRVSTIRDADLILVVEDGEVVGRGRHDDLLETCATYREIVESQLSAEEAA